MDTNGKRNTKERGSLVDNERDEVIVQTSRFDLKTRICLMAAFIFGSMDVQVNEAIEYAVDIENAADARVKRMKKENPVFPADRERRATYKRPPRNPSNYNQAEKV